MDMRNCRRCGKVYMFTGAPICRACMEQDEMDYEKVKQYLYDYPRCSMSEVAEATDVSVKKITRFLREGRLEIVEGSNLFLDCQRCGAAIRTGKYCNACAHNLGTSINSVIQDYNKLEAEEDKFEEARRPRMYTADRY